MSIKLYNVYRRECVTTSNLRLRRELYSIFQPFYFPDIPYKNAASDICKQSGKCRPFRLQAHLPKNLQ